MKIDPLIDHKGDTSRNCHDILSRDSSAGLDWTIPIILEPRGLRKELGNNTLSKNVPPTARNTRTISGARNMDDPPDVATLVDGLIADSESARKYAVFKLQGLLADPSFADAFIQGDGLPALRACVLDANGNAQAYALGSLVVLLELDMGWEIVDGEVVEKVGLTGHGRLATWFAVRELGRRCGARMKQISMGADFHRAIRPYNSLSHIRS